MYHLKENVYGGIQCDLYILYYVSYAKILNKDNIQKTFYRVTC